MARPVSPRPPGELLEVVTRVLRQVGVDDKMSPRRKKAIIESLSKVAGELQKEISYR